MKVGLLFEWLTIGNSYQCIWSDAPRPSVAEVLSSSNAYQSSVVFSVVSAEYVFNVNHVTEEPQRGA